MAAAVSSVTAKNIAASGRRRSAHARSLRSGATSSLPAKGRDVGRSAADRRPPATCAAAGAAGDRRGGSGRAATDGAAAARRPRRGIGGSTDGAAPALVARRRTPPALSAARRARPAGIPISISVIFACRLLRRLIAVSTVTPGFACSGAVERGEGRPVDLLAKRPVLGIPLLEGVADRFFDRIQTVFPIAAVRALIVSRSRPIRQRLAAQFLHGPRICGQAGIAAARRSSTVPPEAALSNAASISFWISAARRNDGSPFTPEISASAKRRALRLTGGMSSLRQRSLSMSLPRQAEASSRGRRSRPSARPWCRAAPATDR